MRPKDYYRTRLIGKRFGKLIVDGFSKINKDGQTVWDCICDCGTKTTARSDSLRRGHKRSCGCLKYPIGDAHWGFKGHEGLIGSLFFRIKANAKNRGILFDVSKKYLWDLFQSQGARCEISGACITLPKNKTELTLSTASLDRKNSSLGYIDGNVQWVTKTINKAKQSLSDGVFIAMCKSVSEFNAG